MKSDSENRTQWKTVRFTHEEAAEVESHAGLCGLSASALIRRRTLGQQLPKGSAPELNRQAWKELSHLAGNFNQLARHANEQKIKDGAAVLDLIQVKQLLIKMDEQVQLLRLDLLGGA